MNNQMTILALGGLVLAGIAFGQESKPSCNQCQATYIKNSEIQAYFIATSISAWCIARNSPNRTPSPSMIW